MLRRGRTGPFLITVLLATLALVGCVRVDGNLTVDGRNDTVSGTISIVVPITEDTSESRSAAARQVLDIETQALPGLRDHVGVVAAPLASEGYFGTELTLERVKIADLLVGGSPLVEREGDRYLVAATIDTAGIPEVPQPAAEGELPPGAAESAIAISLTFPGTVIEAAGTGVAMDGNTVSWQGSWDAPLVMSAEAPTTSASVPPWIWTGLLWGIGAIAVLAVLGLATVWFRSRHD